MRRIEKNPSAALVSFVVLAAFLLGLGAPAGAEDVGTMVEVVEQVMGTPAGGTPAALAVGDAVILDMTVATGRASFAHMTLGPHGSLQIGPEARVVLDRATVDEATGASESFLSVLAGKIRLALSSAFRGTTEVDTPTATIGVKGTIFAVAVDAAGDTVVWTLEGTVEVTSKAGGDPLILQAGFYSTVSRGSAPTGPTPFDPETGVAAVRVLPAPGPGPEEQAIEDPPLPPVGQDLPPRRDDPVDSQNQTFEQYAPPPSANQGQ